jgi:hypothetical protein
MAVLLVGCGSNVSDPTATNVDKLKNPADLSIRDDGDGKVTLFWHGTNNESDFEGYNVYGMAYSVIKDNSVIADAIPEDTDPASGKSIQLLDTDGNASADAKKALALFNYSTDTKFEETAESTNDKGEPQFSALPIHTKSGDDFLLPTCKHNGKGTCEATTADTLGKKVSDDADKYGVNGLISYQASGLEVGTKYCFVVNSAMDKGKKVSASTSRMACVTPRYKASINFTAVGSSGSYNFDLTSYLTACAAAGECADPTTAMLASDSDTFHTYGNTNVREAPLYLEKLSTDLTFVAGHFGAIQDVGRFENGFDDLPLDFVVSPLSLTYAGGGTPTLAGPYYLPGQSVRLQKSHIYAIAVGDYASASIDPSSDTSKYYHLVYISGDIPAVSSGGTMTTEWRLSKNKDQY